MQRGIVKVSPPRQKRHSLLAKEHQVGDFGLATSSLAAVDPSDVSPYAVVLDADMTLGAYSRGYLFLVLTEGRGRNEVVHCP